MSQSQQNKAEFSAEEIEEMREAFNMFDKDRNDKISTSELVTVLRSLGHNPTKHDAEVMLADLDTDGSGFIEFNEFVAAMSNCDKSPDQEQQMCEAFKVFDKDGNGYISRDELKHIVTALGDDRLTDDEVNEMFTVADVDQDGRIDYTEFCKMCVKKK